MWFGGYIHWPFAVEYLYGVANGRNGSGLIRTPVPSPRAPAQAGGRASRRNGSGSKAANVMNVCFPATAGAPLSR